MLKKNKLPIFLLALVVMLSIYYINDTKNNQDDPNDKIVNGDSKYAEYAKLRFELLAERTSTIEEYESQIVDSQLTNEDIEDIMILVNKIYDLNYSEVELENSIKALGYDDVFVCVEDYKVNIDILTDSFSDEEFINVALLSKNIFDTNFVVYIHTTSVTE